MNIISFVIFCDDQIIMQKSLFMFIYLFKVALRGAFKVGVSVDKMRGIPIWVGHQ